MARTLDREQVVERYWPYDGPHDADSITNAADALSCLVRYLSNATAARRELAAPDMYALLGALDEGLGCLRQLTRQVGSTVDWYSADASLRHDQYRGDSAAAQLTANRAARALRGLPASLADLHAAIDDARQHLGHLYHHTDQHEGRTTMCGAAGHYYVYVRDLGHWFCCKCGHIK